MRKYPYNNLFIRKVLSRHMIFNLNAFHYHKNNRHEFFMSLRFSSFVFSQSLLRPFTLSSWQAAVMMGNLLQLIILPIHTYHHIIPIFAHSHNNGR